MNFFRSYWQKLRKLKIQKVNKEGKIRLERNSSSIQVLESQTIQFSNKLRNQFAQQIYIIKREMLKLAKIDSIQKKINQYTYANTDTIGKGFSSQVFKGKNQQTDEQVAIKMIDLKFIKGEVHKNLLANQIEILKLLKHLPNILEFYEVFSTKNNTCIITQLCEGGDLSKLLKEKKILSEQQALPIIKQIINGYKGIYRFGIIHRDLKPANIFFVNGKVKIADFGFAIKQQNIKKQCSYNVGSPVYMPLQALNQNMYSFKSDVWAIGVIFYQMLTGKTPWRAKTESDLKRQIKNNPIKTLLPPNISIQSADFLKKSLELNPVLRMSPQELERFFSKTQNSNDEQIVVQKVQNTKNNLFMTQKRNPPQFRTRAMSNQKDDRISKNQTQYDKYQINFDVTVTQKKKGFLKGLGETGMNFDQLGRTTATIGKKTESNFMCDPKKTFEHFISQIHFCRFLFKLIERIGKSYNIDNDKKVRTQMTNTIFQKLKQTIQLKGLQLKHRDYFKSSIQFAKLLNISNQYEEKYRLGLKEFSLQVNDLQGEETFSEIIAKQIQGLYLLVESSDNPEQICDEVILLDYLITCRQLLHILEKSSLSQFHTKSKIEAIVNGKPTKNITADHIKAIKDKLRTMKLI